MESPPGCGPIRQKEHYMTTDERLNIDEVKTAFEATIHDQKAFFDGLVDGRDDPLVRATYIRFDETECCPIMRVFSYDEIIATAWLLRGGMHRRVAAAMAREGFVMAARESAEGCANYEVPCDKNHLDYKVIDRVTMPSGDVWAIAAPHHEKWPEPDELLFVDDYAVWFELDGEPRSLDDEDLPQDIFASCSLRVNGFRRPQCSVDNQLSDQVPPELEAQLAVLQTALSNGIDAASDEELRAKLQALIPGIPVIVTVEECDDGTNPPNTPPSNLN